MNEPEDAMIHAEAQQAELSQDDVQAVQQLQSAYQTVRTELSKIIVGQDVVLEQLFLAILGRGHCLLEGVPGLAKTLMVSTLAKALKMSFQRVQFTPDLMPADITGTEVIQEDKATGAREFKFLRGPVFTNMLLADEINRTPPKTQAALLESMQERQVTIGGERYELPNPFFVLATQNPIEQEGTYPLPEAQQDRFMFKVFVRYPSFEQEYQIAERTTSREPLNIDPVLEGEQILKLQSLVRRMPVAEHIIRYALRLVRATRVRNEEDGPILPMVRDYVSWGAGPRAVQFLLLGGKARAALQGRSFVNIEDIQTAARPVLRHRIITNFNAESESVTPDTITDHLIEQIDPHAADMPASTARAFAG